MRVYHLCKVHPGAPGPPSWRRPGGPGRRSADSGCSGGAAPSAAAPCRQRGAASGTAEPPRCAQTPAPSRCRRYLPGSSGTPPPGGDRELGEDCSQVSRRKRKVDTPIALTFSSENWLRISVNEQEGQKTETFLGLSQSSTTATTHLGLSQLHGGWLQYNET